MSLDEDARLPWRSSAGRAATEASGNMTLERVPDVARTGVDFIWSER